MAHSLATPPAVLPLLELVRDAADPELLDLLDPHPADRSWIRLLATEDHELWLISWPAGAATDWHDHGASAGAFTVLRGTLTEHTFDGGGLQLVDHHVGDAKAFGAGYAHDVRNASDHPTLSLHAYSPRLTTMTRFRFLGDRLEMLGVERAGEEW
ncbi:cysteine dioxygenase [Nocardioides bizhenqiangii]|uniref:Cysteine dioxygenase family protein n=1 Tax=Nocardioides bizhenqiangii TaxID=3095076 RepID=A0ABZ0ZUQ7_9ACTN|nr:MULTISPECIES: cysteine dioxygenase family protein [unclassified Nocardioides]MDZ5621941.1 cysteine dioxygenase family protein [Nocardioides sp. HM23]WQQ27377.1 cysteine dioxygenase family protein [Nocardioides sp. HM61]